MMNEMKTVEQIIESHEPDLYFDGPVYSETAY